MYDTVCSESEERKERNLKEAKTIANLSCHGQKAGKHVDAEYENTNRSHSMVEKRGWVVSYLNVTKGNTTNDGWKL